MHTQHDRHGFEKPTRTSQAELRNAVRKVVEQYFEDEKAHYQALTREEQKNVKENAAHTYFDLKVLRDWLQEQDKLVAARLEKKRSAIRKAMNDSVKKMSHRSGA